MSKKGKFLITKQKFERVVVRRGDRMNNRTSCAACGADGAMLSIEEASAAYDINVRAVVRLLENAEIHFAELPSGLLLVCIESLQAAIRKSKQ